MSAPAHAQGNLSVGVIGAGAWGTALAAAMRRAGNTVAIWGRDAAVINDINQTHSNTRRLPCVVLDNAIEGHTDLAAVAGAQVLLLSVPAQQMREVCAALTPHVAGGATAVICAKGIERSSSKPMSEVVGETLPGCRIAVLSGPSFAADVARGLPTAVTLACADVDEGRWLAERIGSAAFRPYFTDDVIGTEIGGAAKNVLAIACGIVAGRGLGASAGAALTTRGFAELTRLGQAMGARPETLAGLSGLGDLILTCNSRQSRNMAFGHALGTGLSVTEALEKQPAVSEGVWTAPALLTMAETKGVEMPIARAVAAILAGEMTIDEAIRALLSRPFRAEGE